MPEKAPLTLSLPDINGYVPEVDLAGRLYEHTGNGKIYMLSHFTWLGETDQWGYVMVEHGRMGAVHVTRPMEHLTGKRSNGEDRYIPRFGMAT